jgi:hypothetical protein
VNVPLALPVFLMSTVPVAVLPGTMLLAVRIAELAFEFECEIVPAVKTLLGLALVELKFAPDPTATAATTNRAPKARSTFRGDAFHKDFILVMAISLAVIADRQPTD